MWLLHRGLRRLGRFGRGFAGRLPFVFGDFVVEHFLQGRLNDRTPDVRDGIVEGPFLSVIFQLAGRGLLRQSGIEIAPIDDDEVGAKLFICLLH